MPQIERVRGISPEQLWKTYVLGRKPVIVTDLLDDFPHKDVASIVAEFRDVEVADLAPTSAGRTGTTLGEWHDFATAGVKVPKVDPTAAYSAPTFDLPLEYSMQAKRFYAFAEQLKTPLDRRIETLGLGPVLKGTALMFFGYRETTICHADGWVTENLTAHIAGSKEWFLVPPQNIAALGPFGAQIVAQPLNLPKMQREALAEAVGGYSFTVNTGETLYWPHQWLHGTYYPEPSISFVQHFGRDLVTAFMSREVHRCFYRHALLEKLFPIATVEERYWSEFVQLHDVCKRDYADAHARITAIDEVLSALYAQFFPDQPLVELPCNFSALRELAEKEALRFHHPEDGAPVAGRRAWAKVTELPLYNWWE